MDVKLVFCAHSLKSPTPRISKTITVEENTVNFRCPSPLLDAGFPVKSSTFNVDMVLEAPQPRAILQRAIPTAAREFVERRKNLVVFSYGVRSTPKRQLMFGSDSGSGYAAKVIADAVEFSAGRGIFAVSAYGIGSSEHLTDFTDLGNEMGVIVESVKEGPRVRMVGRHRVTSTEDVRSVFSSIVKNYQQHFDSVLCEQQPTAELEALPPYMPESMVVQLYHYEDENAFDDYMESNSLTFVALGDCERPVLCGIDEKSQQEYEKAQKILASAVGIVSSIRCSRLRIPFGKSKLSQLLRRAYNAEKGNPNNDINEATSTAFIIHAFSDAVWTEESYHCLVLTRRVSNVVGASSIGSVTRDLAVDKWRLDQDIMELRDELFIARSVYDYRPCIYDQPKPVQNIREEEQKRISAIVEKREASREKQLKLIREQARQDADKIIEELEAKTGTTLAALEQSLEAKKKENSLLQADREKRIQEYEQTLEKIRKKKQEEESACKRLREEMLQLEQELSIRQDAIEGKQKRLEMIKLDKAKGRDAVVRERQSIQAMRKTVLEERRRQREQWIVQIKEINAKVVDQIRMLAEERKKNGEQPTAKEEAAEQAVLEDVRVIEDFMPKLISLEDVPVNPDETEAFRRQFAEVFAEEKKVYLAKIEEERARKEKLERGLDAYRQRLLDTYQAKKKEKMHSAITKEQHLNSLIDQVLTYLRNGVRMTKVSSKGNVRRRFYFLSEDFKRIHSCEIDQQGAPISRKKPPVTIWLRDIKKVVIGVYTSSFTDFSSEAQLARTRPNAVSDTGTYRQDPTPNVTPSNIGLNNYRAFALLLRGGKSLEVVCETDSDCEAWLVALKRLLHVKSPIERVLEKHMNGNMKDPQQQADQGTVEIKWGGPLDIHNMRGFVSLSSEEAALCSENHIPPMLFLRIRQEMSEKAERNMITIYDVRVSSGLDLFRSGKLYDFLCEKKIIPLPY
uniref:PH domain-containing protein n=1 Tax=Trypanosoma congolense (strain IL3000) TaxID=1068625 RepID=G0UK21_TRYCI|nr:conserved hypothetical protein [Trypanosoma congolense IL3000]